MYLVKLMEEHGFNLFDLSRISGVPESTLRGILSGKAKLDHCNAGTLLFIADALGTTVKDILHHYWNEHLDKSSTTNNRKPVHDGNTLLSFYKLTETMLNALNSAHDTDFVHIIYEDRWIERFFCLGQYRHALFLLGLTDYLNRKHGNKADARFDAYRAVCLDRPVFALNMLEEPNNASKVKLAKTHIKEWAIPELAAFNIFMSERDIRSFP